MVMNYMKITNNLKNSKKNIIYILFVLFFDILIYYKFYTAISENKLKYNVIFIAFMFITNFMITWLIYLFNKKRNLSIEKKFLLISLIFGLLYLVGIPIMKGTDEPPHFFRIYQISTGNIIVKDEKDVSMIPDNLFRFAWLDGGMQNYNIKKITEKFSDNEIVLNNGHAPTKYSPIQYFPQIIGFNLGRLLGFGPFLCAFLTRFMNFVFWLVISFYAIKILPINREFVALLYAAPAMLSLVSTMSGDALLNACVLLFISIILNLYYNKKELKIMLYILLIVLTVIISTIKIVYFPVLFLIFLISKNQYCIKIFKNIKISKLICLIILFSIGIGSTFFWYKISNLSVTSGNAELPSSQLSFIIHNPVQYLLIFGKTLTNDVYYYLVNLVAGKEMCYGIVKINGLLVLGYFITWVLSFFCSNMEVHIKKYVKVLIAFLFIVIVGAVSTVMYINYTITNGGVGYNSITGIQSRYFISLIPILILIFPAKKIKCIKTNYIYDFWIIFNGLILMETVCSIVTACIV